MSKSKHPAAPVDLEDGAYVEVTLRLTGNMAEGGELPASDLGASLIGWDRVLQLAYYTQETSALEPPKPGTSSRVYMHVQRVGKGSVLVIILIWFGLTALEGVISNRSDAVGLRLFKWTKKLVATHVDAKRKTKTLDGVVDRLEEAAKTEGIRFSNNREVSEDFATALNAALSNATLPLDSSAARSVLSLKGQDVDIVVDEQGRAAIRAPFEPPALDPDADDVIEAPVKFIRINRKTGYGLLQFVRPQDESQVSQQRFHCDDKSIRRRANQYTGAFHHDTPIRVKLQRKAYQQSRRGHYWLIVGTASAAEDDGGLFSSVRPPKPRKRGKKPKK